MRFICLGYADPEIWKTLTEQRLGEMMEECFAYDDELRRGGHFVGGEALEGAASAVTLRFADGPDEVHRNAIAKMELGKHAA